MEITTTFSIDLEMGREDYIRKAILGDYTSFSIRRSYLTFECQESLEAFCNSHLEELLQYTYLFYNMSVLSCLFLSSWTTSRQWYFVAWEIDKWEKSRCFWERTQKISVRVRRKRSRTCGESMELWEKLLWENKVIEERDCLSSGS